MMSSSPNPRHDSESGFVLLAALVLVVLLLISLSIAAPKMARAIQRDKDLETIHRGEQYREAIKLYYQKFGAYPTSVKQLLNTNNMRFLRQEYADPQTGKNDWKPVLFGQAHVRPLGFFGKPLTAMGGLAASGALGVGFTPGMYAIEPNATDANGNPVSGTENPAGATGTNPAAPAGQSSAFGNTGGSAFGNPSPSSGMFGSGQNGMGSGIGQPIGGMGATPGGGSPTGSGFGTSSSTSGTTFGAEGIGPIVGFTLPVKKPSLIDYMEQTAYNKWEFNYDPAADQLQQAVSLLGGGSSMNNSNSATTALGANSTTTGAGNSNLFGSQNGNSGTQNGNNPGPTGPTPPTSNPQPQNPDNPQQ
jgi:type II secretory pathway pseudopilin PulG